MERLPFAAADWQVETVHGTKKRLSQETVAFSWYLRAGPSASIEISGERLSGKFARDGVLLANRLTRHLFLGRSYLP